VELGDEGLILQFLKEGSEEGALYYDLVLQYYLPLDMIEAREEGITITRDYFAYDDVHLEESITKGAIGDVLKGRITVVVPKERHFVAVESPIPAGTELVNFALATSDKSLQNTPFYDDYSYRSKSSWYWWLNPWTHTEMRDDRLLLFADYMNPGVYTYDFYVRVTHAGEFASPPARVEEMYFPEVWGRTAGEVFVGK